MPFDNVSSLVEFVLTFLIVGLVVFAVLAAVAWVVVRELFVRMAERFAALGARPDERAFLAHLDRVERLMDRQIPLPVVGGIGLDAILGFVPYVGDTISALVSGSLILQSIRFGVPRDVVSRMVSNLFVDLLLGAVPVIGDLFDIAFKANTRNIALVRAYLARAGGKSGPPRG